MGIFLFTTVSRTALWPTQPPIQWVLGALSLGVKQPGREADHSTSEVKVYGHTVTPALLEAYIYLSKLFIEWKIG
jgi:hypothetical protein